MIVRILGDNQYVLDTKYLDKLNELDNCMVDHLSNEEVDEFSSMSARNDPHHSREGNAARSGRNPPIRSDCSVA